ncbi:MAG: adenylate/guanylate cyclase domain-containing protein [Candidatus Baltobacteraceae bacterium]
MNKRLRTLALAVILAAVASATGVLLFIIPNDRIPLFHYVADLNAHISALDGAASFGLAEPAYDTQPNDDIGIITIDDVTLKRGVPGPWPFAHGFYGDLLTKLKAAGAKTVVFDIEFLERSTDPAQDARFAKAMRSLPTVLAYSIDTTNAGRIGESRPAPSLLPSAAASGFLTVDTPGGYLIGQPLQVTTDSSGSAHQNERLFSLAASAYQTYRGRDDGFKGVPLLDGHTFVLLPPTIERRQDIATGTQALLPAFAGRGVISFSDAYRENAGQLAPFARGALIYIGASAQGLGDFSTTARGRMEGLFVNARLADQLLRRIYVQPAPAWINVLLIVTLPLLIALGFTFVRTPFAIAASLLGTLAFAYVNLVLFITRLVWVDLIHVIVAMLLATLFVALYRVLHEGSQRRLVTGLFGTHVSPAVVKDILAQDERGGALALQGKKVTATIFYSDIRGFTAMSERMTPEEIYAQLNEYFEAMCAIIFEYGGYVDKFIGDCVMAVFSAPYQRPDDALNAVRAAVAQQKKITELSTKWKAQGKAEFTVGMGINTGEVVMGNLGAHSRMNYTVIGDTVNLAARLYNVAKAGEIIVSDNTYKEVEAFVVGTEMEPVMVKGKRESVRIYAITRVKDPRT